MYRNSAVVGGPAVERIPVGAMIRAAAAGGGAGYLGHNEVGRHRILDDWVRGRGPAAAEACGGEGAGGGGRVAGVRLAEQERTMALLSRLCEALDAPQAPAPAALAV